MNRQVLLKAQYSAKKTDLSHCYINVDVYLMKENRLLQIGVIDTALFKMGWLGNNSDKILKKALQHLIWLAIVFIKTGTPLKGENS